MFNGWRLKKGFFLIAALFFAACPAGPSGGAGSAGPQESFADMPTFNIFSDEEIQRDFVRMDFEKPLDRSELGFRLLIPEAWEEVALTVSAEQLARDDENIISLALLKAPDAEVRVEIAYCRVPQTMDLAGWARAYLEGNNLEVLHFQEGTFSKRQVFDTLLKAPEDYRVRMTFSRHGDKIYILSGSAPGALYEEYMKVLGLAAVSFEKS